MIGRLHDLVVIIVKVVQQGRPARSRDCLSGSGRQGFMPSGPSSLRLDMMALIRFRPASDMGSFPVGGSVIQEDRASPFTMATLLPRSSQNMFAATRTPPASGATCVVVGTVLFRYFRRAVQFKLLDLSGIVGLAAGRGCHARAR